MEEKLVSINHPIDNALVDYFQILSTSATSEMTLDQLAQCSENVHKVLSVMSSNNLSTLSTDRVKASLFAETVALLRSQVGLASNNKSNALLLLVSIKERDMLPSLLQQFSLYTEYVQQLVTVSSQRFEDDLPLVTLLRLLQLFHNLLNLCFAFQNELQTEDFVSKFMPLFDLKWLSFFTCLYEPKHHEDRLNSLFAKLCYVFTANLYSCLKNSESMQSLILMNHSKEMAPVWKHILDHIRLEISEWSLWAIFLGLKRDNFFEMLYIGVGQEDRLLILDIASEFVEGEHKDGDKVILTKLNFPEDYLTLSQSSNGTLPNDCVKFIMNLFKSEITSFLQLAQSGNIETLNEDMIRLICKLSSLLLKISSMDIFRKVIQQEDTFLVGLLVNLLKNIQLLGKTNPDSVFAPRGQLKDVNQDEDEFQNPAYGFKRDIIGLLANVTYRNHKAQEFLRTSDGLAALLDCAKIDARNPFILQWSIFAIRNALESNASNQQFVAQMNQQGILKDDLLNQIESNNSK